MGRALLLQRPNFRYLWLVFSLGLLLFCGCGHRQTLVEIANRAGQYRVGNGDEPSDLDPQIAIGQIEHDIMLSLYEGLVYGDAKDVSPRPAWPKAGTFRPTVWSIPFTSATMPAGPMAIP